MKYKKLLSTFLVVSFLSSTVSPVFADGIIVYPPDQNVTEAEQTALIIHNGSVEDLIISVAVEGTAENFGWILPVPSRPTVEKANIEIFSVLGEMTEPKQNLLEKLKEGFGDYPTIMPIGVRMETMSLDAKQVQVLEEKRIGILDIAVLSVSDPEALEDWLEENGYQLPNNENKYYTPREQINKNLMVLQEYIDNDWFFIAAKVNAKFIAQAPLVLGIQDKPELELTLLPNLAIPVEEPVQDIQDFAIAPYYPRYQQARVTPLHITFDTTRIVYPMKITSLSRSGCSVLLYVWADKKVEVTNYNQESYYTESKTSLFATEYAGEGESKELEEWLPELKDNYLTKLYASYINPNQMKEDLRFKEAESQKNIATGEMAVSDWVKLPLYALVYGPIRLFEYATGLSNYYYRIDNSMLLHSISIVLGLGALGIIWTVGLMFAIKKTTKKVLRKFFYVLQFPGVWVTANILSTAFVLVYYFAMSLAQVEDNVILFNSFLVNSMAAMLLAGLIYKLQSKIVHNA